MSFKLKTIMLFLAISIVPYTITMLFLGNTLREEQSRTITKELQTQLTITRQNIVQNLQRLQSDLDFMAKSEVMNDLFSDDLDRRISRMLLAKKEMLKLDGDFYLVSKKGLIIASSDFGQIASLFEDTPLYSIPVRLAFNTQPVATLHVTYKLDNLTSVFTNTPQRHYYVQNAQNEILLRPSKFNEALQARTSIEALGIDVILEEDKAHAYALLYTYERWFLVTLVIGLIVIVLIALYFAITLIRPIITLSKTANTVTATQNYETRVDVNRSDEIGQLGSAFNAMIQGMHRALDEIGALNSEIEDT